MILLVSFFKIELVVPYFYFIFVVIFLWLIPTLVIARHQKILPSVIKTGLFFAVVTILYEYVASYKESWLFPGDHFVGWVTLFGVRFPFEELMWVIFFAPCFLVLYEALADDLK